MGGGRPSFPSPWQPNQTNNTAGAGPGAGWQPVQPTNPASFWPGPGNRRAGAWVLETLLLPLPWGCREEGRTGTLAAGSGCKASHFSLGVPRTDMSPHQTPAAPQVSSPPPTNHSRASSFLSLPFLLASDLSMMPHLSCSPAPGPGISCPPIPAPDATLGTATLQPPQPRAAPLVPEVMTRALAPGGSGPAGG